MKSPTPECCPYCSCKDISRPKEQGLMEIGPFEFDQEEDSPLDIWICSECQRRFIVLDDREDE